MQFKEITNQFVEKYPLLLDIQKIANQLGNGLYLTGPAAYRCVQGKQSPYISLAYDSDVEQLVEKISLDNSGLKTEYYGDEIYLKEGISPVISIVRIKKLRGSKSETDISNFPSLKDVCVSHGFQAFSFAVSVKKRSTGKTFDYNDGLKALEQKQCSLSIKVKELEARHILYHGMLESDSEGTMLEWLYPYAVLLKDELQKLPRPLLTAALMQILSAAKPSRGLIALFHSGFMHGIFPEAANMAGVEQRKEYHHKDVFFHTCEVVDNLARVNEDVWLRFAALVHDIAKPHTKKFIEGTGWSFHAHDEIGARIIKGVFRRLKLPEEKLQYIQKMIRLHLRPAALAKDFVTDSAVRRLINEAGSDLKDLMQLCRADITSKNHSKVSRFLRNYDAVETRVLEVNARDEAAAFQSPVRGEDIMAVCNIGPSKLVGVIKSAIEDAILQGTIMNTYEDAYAYMLKIKDEYLPK